MSELHFLRPGWLLALLPVLGILVLLWRSRAGGSAWRGVVDPALLDRLWLEPPGRVSRLPLGLLSLGWLLSVLALAGPVWERQPEPVWQTAASRILILDLSSSMDAADLAPSRLERARFKILDILAKAREGRTGLVVFAGEPHTVTPLTDDAETIANLLSALRTDIVPLPGDVGAPALQLAGELLAQAGAQQGDILLLSDGLADPAAALGVARQLRTQGYRLSVLAVGTVQGAPVPQADGGFGKMARLPVEPLQELARAGGGAFSLLTADDRDLARVLLEPYLTDPRQEQADTGVERWIEQGVWLLLPLLLLAAAGFRRGWLGGLLAVLILPPPAQALEWRDLWWRKDQQAAQALQQGQAAVAAERFEDPAWRGMAQYQAGDYTKAAEAFAASPGLDSVYNRGNALARAGQLQQAMAAYREVLQQDPAHADAKANLALLEQLMQQQQQQSQQGSQSEQHQQQQAAQAGAEPEQQSAAQQDQEQQPASAEQQAQNQAVADQAQEQAGTSPEQISGSETPNQVAEPLQEDSMQAARRDVTGQPQPQREQSNQQGMPQGDSEVLAEPSQQAEPPDEKALALQQWLRQIPEDPAGLLRRKFMVEHLQRKRDAAR
jgi:Ca-activated chloride channel family protein